MRYLLDTNVISEPLRLSPDAQVMARLERHQDDLAIPSPVWHELRFGCLRLPKSRKRSTIEAYLENVVGPTMPILAYDDAAAAFHARERARLARQGRPPAFVDGQIAAIAATSSLILVTRNVDDFRRFHEVRIECWHGG